MNSAMRALDKKQIERQFERAARSYDQAASMQREISERLIEHLVAVSLDPYPSEIADLGCGTGKGLSQLYRQFPSAALTGVDISSAMLDLANVNCPPATLIKADIEQLPLDSGSFNIVFTSSSLQWCDLHRAIGESARIMRPGAHLAIATFGPATQREWRTAWGKTDGQRHTLSYPDLPNIIECIERNGLQPLLDERELRTLQFDTTADMLQSVKQIGATNANSDRQRGLMGKERFAKFLRAFEVESPNMSLTYEVFYVIAQKGSGS